MSSLLVSEDLGKGFSFPYEDRGEVTELDQRTATDRIRSHRLAVRSVGCFDLGCFVFVFALSARSLVRPTVESEPWLLHQVRDRVLRAARIRPAVQQDRSPCLGCLLPFSVLAGPALVDSPLPGGPLAAVLFLRPLLLCQVTTPTTNPSVRSSDLSVLRPFPGARVTQVLRSPRVPREALRSFSGLFSPDSSALHLGRRYRYSAPGEYPISCYGGRGPFLLCMLTLACGASVRSP